MSAELQLLTPPQKAKELQVSESTLARWRRKGTGPEFVRLGSGPRALVRYLPLRGT